MVKFGKKILGYTWQGIMKIWRGLSYNPRALVMLTILVGVSLLNPLWQVLDHRRYQLSREASEIVGPANKHLAEKISLNTAERKFEFNASAKTAQPAGDNPEEIAAQLAHKQQTGGAGEEDENLYALDLPIDPTEGTTFYDTNTQTSFTMTPQFAKGEARSENGQIIYPVLEGGQAVYTAKANGVKEDIILEKPRGDELSFAYELDIPETLEARLIEETGELGIYSADPVLFGDISFGTAEDEEKVQNARQTAPKNHLTFVLPAPVIIQSGHTPHEATAEFTLEDNILTVEAYGLAQLSYPISVDPSVIITSSNEFLRGNNDGNIVFATDQVNRSTLKSGEVEAWANSTNLTTTRAFMSAVAYNGYLYTGGGFTNTWGGLASVEYAPINSNGTIGTWQTTTAFPSGRWYHSMATYNGYLYSLGGSPSAEVIYAPINDNGTIGAWNTTTALPSARQNFATNTYDGRIYVFGGNNGTTNINTVQYASFNGDGTLSAWQNATSLTSGRQYPSATIYNGYAYIMGGLIDAGSLGQVEYVRINPDGSLGAWAATTAYTPTRYGARATAVDGYLYLTGGIMGDTYHNTTQYASVNADGTLGIWRNTGNITSPRAHGGIATHQGRIYMIGGTSGSDGSNTVDTTEFTTLRPPGYTTPYTATTSYTTARARFASTVYNGFLYVSGGFNNDAMSAVTNTTRYAALNANGTTGTWQTGTALPVSRYGHGMVAYNDYMYLLGGFTTGGVVNTVHYAVINADGSLGAWTAAANNFTTARHSHGSVVHNGYLYVVGGADASAYYATVEYATIQSGGNVGAWSATTSMPIARSELGVVVVNGYIYSMGGRDAGTLTSAVNYAPLNSNGTIGTWTATNAFNAPALMTMAVTVANGHIYLAGGRIGAGTAQSAVQYTRTNPDGSLNPWQFNTSLPAARLGNQLAFANGYLYHLGGHNNTTLFDTTHYTSINNGGLGLTGTWASTASLGTARSLHGAVAHNGRIYAFGGINSSNTPLSSVEYATINQNGTVGSWTTTTSMPAPRAYFGSLIANGYIYVIGGYSSVSPTITPTNGVYYAPINTDGTVGTWQTGPNFTTARGALAAATYQQGNNTFIYLLGGFNGTTTRYDDVQVTPANRNTGALSGWTATTSFSGGRASHDAIAYGAHLYIFGGQEHSTLNILNDVQQATINGDGTVGSWARTTSFSTPRFGTRVFAHNGYMYLTGGNNNSIAFARTEYAAINREGQLGEWRTSPSTFATARNNHAIAYDKGRLYIVGGNNTAGNRLGDTQYAGLNMQPQNGRYTRLVDFERPVRLLSISHSLVPYAQDNMFFATAGEDGIFGARQPIFQFSGPLDGVRYVQIYANLDDSLRTNFNLDARSLLTNITLDYRPTYLPEERLRHGKFFFDGEMIQMDTE